MNKKQLNLGFGLLALIFATIVFEGSSFGGVFDDVMYIYKQPAFYIFEIFVILGAIYSMIEFKIRYLVTGLLSSFLFAFIGKFFAVDFMILDIGAGKGSALIFANFGLLIAIYLLVVLIDTFKGKKFPPAKQ